MSEIEVLEDIATKAIHRLRIETLNAGQPFMLNVNGLPANQCYLEFPDLSIQLVSFIQSKNDFTPIRKLTQSECEDLRRQVGL